MKEQQDQETKKKDRKLINLGHWTMKNMFMMFMGIAFAVVILHPLILSQGADSENLMIVKTDHAETYMLENNGTLVLQPNAPQTCNSTVNVGALYFNGSSFFECDGSGWSALGSGGSQLTQEEVEDYVGGMTSGTETRITVTYDDAGGNLNYVVDDMNDDDPEAGEVHWTDLTDQGTFTDTKYCTYASGTGFISCDSEGGSSGGNSTEEMQDAVWTNGIGTTTRVTVTYQDGTNDVDFIVDDMNDDDPEAGEVHWTDLTDQGTFTDTKYCTYASGTGFISCNSEGGGTDTNESVRMENIVGTACSSGNFIFNFSNDGTPQCDAPAGSGDITAVYTNGQYLTGGGASGDISLTVVESVLNATIDARASSFDTNASSICSGTTTYLDGEGNCDDISGVYVQASDWTTIDNYPADCGAGNVVKGLGDTLTCVADDFLTQEEVEDYVGGMLGGTETYISVTYQDATGDIDFIVTDNWWDADADISADEISESKINFATTCGAGNHLYVSGNDLACESDDYNSAFDTEDEIEAVIFDSDNTANLGMGNYNITAVQCITFQSGGKICSG